MFLILLSAPAVHSASPSCSSTVRSINNQLDKFGSQLTVEDVETQIEAVRKSCPRKNPSAKNLLDELYILLEEIKSADGAQ
jgi:hypothetical protein